MCSNAPRENEFKIIIIVIMTTHVQIYARFDKMSTTDLTFYTLAFTI